MNILTKTIHLFKEEEFFRHLFKDSFTEKAKKKDQRQVENCITLSDKLGYVHFCAVKEKLITEGKNIGKIEKIPYDYRTARTFKTFLGWIHEPSITWYTPNTFSTSKPWAMEREIINDYGEVEKEWAGGRSDKYLRWLNAFYIDIDSKNKTIEELHDVIKKCHLPDCTVINETKRGYHIYWILEDRVPASPKAKKLYKHISTNLILTFKSHGVIHADSQVVDPTRYMQIPRNIIFNNYENKPSMKLMQEWLNCYGKKNYKTQVRTTKDKKIIQDAPFLEGINIEIKSIVSEKDIKKTLKDNSLPTPIISKDDQRLILKWNFDTKVPGSPRALKLYNHISNNIILALLDAGVKEKDCVVINRCETFKNSKNTHSFLSMKNWLNTYGKMNYKKIKGSFNVYSQNTAVHENRYISNEARLNKAMAVLLSGVKNTKRNKTCFALACYYKAIGVSIERTTEILINWNQKNEQGEKLHTNEEVAKTIKSVFSSEIKGIPFTMIHELTGINAAGFYKHRKSREVRMKAKLNKEKSNLHNREWVAEIVFHMLKRKVYLLESSQSELADMLGIPLSTFKLIVKEIKQKKYAFLSIKVNGKGRNATTVIVLNEIIIKKTLNNFRYYELGEIKNKFEWDNDGILLIYVSYLMTLFLPKIE